MPVVVECCRFCHNLFIEYSSNNRKFCSKQCYHTWMRQSPGYRPWNAGKAGTYHHSREAREKKRSLMKRLVREGRFKPPKQKPYLLVDQQAGILLHRLYVVEGLSAREIAKKLNCSGTTILRRLRMFNIAMRKPKNEISIIDEKDWFFECPCFLCPNQICCGSHSHSKTPRNCERLTAWLLQKAQKIRTQDENIKLGRLFVK